MVKNVYEEEIDRVTAQIDKLNDKLEKYRKKHNFKKIEETVNVIKILEFELNDLREEAEKQPERQFF